jgi:hypothetical protein
MRSCTRRQNDSIILRDLMGAHPLPHGVALSETIHIRLDQTDRRQLNKKAEELGVTRSEVIRQAIARYLKEETT